MWQSIQSPSVQGQSWGYSVLSSLPVWKLRTLMVPFSALHTSINYLSLLIWCGGVTSFLNWLWVIFTPAKFAVSPGGGPGHAEAEHSYSPDRNPIKDLCHCSHCWQVVSHCPGDYWCPNPGLAGLLLLSLQEHPCSGEYIQAHGGQTHYCYQRFLRSSSCGMFGLKLYNPWCQKMITRLKDRIFNCCFGYGSVGMLPCRQSRKGGEFL